MAAKTASKPPPRKTAKAPVKPRAGTVAASFEFAKPGAGGVRDPVWMSTTNSKTMIDSVKGRNNYYRMKFSVQASMCRRMSERNWFLRPVHELRQASTIEDFEMRNSDGVSMEDHYDFFSLVNDIVFEDIIASNVVCMWRKGEDLPSITVLDAEIVEYSVSAGIERIVVTYAKDEVMAKDKAGKNDYIEALGPEMYKAQTTGGTVTIIKGEDEFWDFEVMISGKRRGVFCIPEPVPVLDKLDYLELMGVGDWNLAWFRKDVIRQWKKGYKVTQGQGAGVNSVDISKKNIKDLGEGSAKINGAANVPMNHDVEASYLTVPPESFDPKQVETAIDALMLYGGIEAVVLLGSFSQQNGAAPSLMRNSRTMAFARRKRVQHLLRRIFSAEEFSSLDWGSRVKEGAPVLMKAHWGVKSLYSIEELMALVSGTNDGTASTQTRRGWLDLDNEMEVARLQGEHADRSGYAPPFEAGQNLLPSMFPQELGKVEAAPATPAKPKGKPGAPKKVKS